MALTAELLSGAGSGLGAAALGFPPVVRAQNEPIGSGVTVKTDRCWA